MKLHIKSQPFSTAKQFFAQTFKKLVGLEQRDFQTSTLTKVLIFAIGLFTLFPFTSTQSAHAHRTSTSFLICNVTDQDIDVAILHNFSTDFLRSGSYKRVKNKSCKHYASQSSTQDVIADNTFYFNVRQFYYSSYDNYWCIDTTTDTSSLVIWDGDTKIPYFKETDSRNTTANKKDIFDRCSNLGPSYRMVSFKKFSEGRHTDCTLIFYDDGEYISLC